MAAGLLMIIYLLVMPVISGLLSSSKLVQTRSILEVSDNRKNTQRMVVTRLKNMLDASPGATIEVVAWGDGINLLRCGSTQQQAIQSLMEQKVIFTACQNSLQQLAANSSTAVELLPGVRLTPDGPRYAERLKDDGYIDELA